MFLSFSARLGRREAARRRGPAPVQVPLLRQVARVRGGGQEAEQQHRAALQHRGWCFADVGLETAQDAEEVREPWAKMATERSQWLGNLV